ncbi:hypothetical protein DM02DRAFT_237679 [Periconia macrospinosa]|uniref:Uncharacterized protein n=1 Tax=Periconia macrospinosa TaxID=97972 RepID=A0A2V1ECX1_9PLEO|nr:hypothetical protein DM02DRAFT_237679 [Periconia macrospinosa]
MGLPMWRAPSPEDAHDALKKDPTANARSPIRRRRPTRSPTSPRHFHNVAVDHHPLSRHDASSTRSRSRSRSRSRPPPPPPAPESPNFWRRGEHLSRTAAPPPPEERETRFFFRLSTDAPRGLSLDPRRSLPALTPNFAPATTSRNIRRSSRHDSPIDTHDRSTYRSRSPWDSLRADGSDRRPRIMLRSGRRNMPDGPLPSSSLRESWSPTTTVDGLGDRDRSLTPVEESSHWEPFLNGVVPDPLAPTADSSFTSAAASASFSNSQPSSRASSSNSNSASSSRTHITIPSRSQSFSLEQFLRNCDTSEDDGASETEEEDTETPSSFHPAYPGFGVGTRILQNPYRQSRSIRNQAHESAVNVRSFYGEIIAHDSESQVDGPEGHHPDASTEEPAEERTSTDEELPLDQELRDARALLERLTRRDDVSDEFWASVGLQRPLADRLERIQQHERL